MQVTELSSEAIGGNIMTYGKWSECITRFPLEALMSVSLWSLDEVFMFFDYALLYSVSRRAPHTVLKQRGYPKTTISWSSCTDKSVITGCCACHYKKSGICSPIILEHSSFSQLDFFHSNPLKMSKRWLVRRGVSPRWFF